MRRAFVLSLLLACSSAFAQVVVTSQGYATSQGPAIVMAPASQPLVKTPIMDLNQTSPASAGATTATAGNRAGATNATLNNVSVSEGAVRTQPILTNVPFSATSEQIAASQAAEQAEGGASAAAAGSAQAQSPGAVPRQTAQYVDIGVRSGGDPYLSSLPGGKSLGEIAAELRKTPRPNAERTVTNEDVNRLPDARPKAPEPNTAPETSPEQESGPSAGILLQREQQGLKTSGPDQMTQEIVPQERRELAQANSGAMAAAQDISAASSEAQETDALAGELPSTNSDLPLFAVVGVAVLATGLALRTIRSRRATRSRL